MRSTLVPALKECEVSGVPGARENAVDHDIDDVPPVAYGDYENLKALALGESVAYNEIEISTQISTLAVFVAVLCNEDAKVRGHGDIINVDEIPQITRSRAPESKEQYIDSFQWKGNFDGTTSMDKVCIPSSNFNRVAFFMLTIPDNQQCIQATINKVFERLLKPDMGHKVVVPSKRCRYTLSRSCCLNGG